MADATLILAVDTAGPVLGVAILAAEPPGTARILAAREYPGQVRHVENLPGAVEDLLSARGIGLSELSAVAVSRGPGSFTGLRVGTAFGKALSLARGLPLVATDSLEALARCEQYGIPAPELRDHSLKAPSETRLIVPAIDARKGRYYAALFSVVKAELSRLSGDRDLTPTALAELVGRWRYSAARCLVPGAAGDELAEQLGGESGAYRGASAAVGLAIGAQAALGRGETLGRYEGPSYLRESDIGIRARQPRFQSEGASPEPSVEEP